ncbi:MAG TPA: PilN domain-containing protein [Micromonosporaceae bacterium]|nr:PilN domain-containing protein [Micromonosporaceae bacterium]
MTTPTTIQEPPSAPAPGALRLVPIAADLLPAEVVDARRGRRARRLVLSSLAALVLVLGGLYAATVLETAVARTELNEAEDRARALSDQQKRYADVVGVQQESEAIEAQLATLMANDLRWSAVLASLRSAAPAGVRLTNVSAGLDAPGNQAAPENAAQLPTSAKPIGDIDITGSADTKPQIAAYVDALARTPNLADPYLSNVTEDNQELQFTLRVSITESALGGRFTPEKEGN